MTEKNMNKMRPLTETERKFATENYSLIDRFLRIKKADPEECFDEVVFDFILSVQKWLSDMELQQKTTFEAVSFKYMEWALLDYYRRKTAKKRSSIAGIDVSFEDAELENYLQGNTENILDNLEYAELLEKIANRLTEKQYIVFSNRLKGFSLKEISQQSGISENRIYKHFARVKEIVAEIMDY